MEKESLSQHTHTHTHTHTHREISLHQKICLNHLWDFMIFIKAKRNVTNQDVAVENEMYSVFNFFFFFLHLVNFHLSSSTDFEAEMSQTKS